MGGAAAGLLLFFVGWVFQLGFAAHLPGHAHAREPTKERWGRGRKQDERDVDYHGLWGCWAALTDLDQKKKNKAHGAIVASLAGPKKFQNIQVGREPIHLQAYNSYQQNPRRRLTPSFCPFCCAPFFPHLVVMGRTTFLRIFEAWASISRPTSLFRPEI